QLTAASTTNTKANTASRTSCTAETTVPLLMAHSVGADTGIHPPTPVRAETCATTTRPIVQPTAASSEPVSVATQATGTAAAPVSTAIAQRRNRPTHAPEIGGPYPKANPRQSTPTD